MVHLAPSSVQAHSGLHEIVAALASDPVARAVFVTDQEDRLVGWIPERALDSGLLMATLPSDLWRFVGELDMRELLRASHGASQTAQELMTPAKTVTGETLLRDAIIGMARHGQHVVALIDDQQRLLGYLTLFDALAALSRQA